MAVHTDQLNVMTHEQYWPDVVSQVTTETPFMTRLLKRAQKNGSGVSFKWTVAHKMEDGQWYAGYEILDIAPIDEFLEAELDWRNFNIPLSISAEELYKNSGKEAFHDLLAEKMKLLRDRARYYMGNGVFRGGGAAAKEWHGFNLGGVAGGVSTGVIAEDPSSRAYASITAGTADAGSGDFTNWWQNHYINGGDAVLDLGDFTAMVNELQSRSAKTSIIVTTFAGMNALEVKLLSQQRYVMPSAEIADLGFVGINVKGIPCVGDVHCYHGGTSTSSPFFFLDESDLCLKFVKGRFMKREPWRSPIDQDAQIMHVRNSGLFAVLTPRKHGQIHSVAN